MNTSNKMETMLIATIALYMLASILVQLIK